MCYPNYFTLRASWPKINHNDLYALMFWQLSLALKILRIVIGAHQLGLTHWDLK